MAKESGLGMALAVDDSTGTAQTISNDVTEFEFATPRGVQEVTGIDKSAMERLLLLADFSITMKGVFNDAANMSHAVLKTVPSTSVLRAITISVSGQTLACETMISDYAMSRSSEGELTWEAPAALANGAVPTWS
jgi:hypothetical protein